jgi:hypothetical protein
MLRHIRHSIEYIEAPGLYFGKSGLMQALLKSLKKRLNVANRSLVLSIIIEILTKNCNHALRMEIHKYINVEVASSIQANERAIFINFCHEIEPHISKRYFSEAFLDSYMNILTQERCQTVVIALLKSAKDIRRKLDDPPLLLKLDQFFAYWRGEKK